jgi:Pyridoxamine 5'-phosphate oxidase
MATAQADTSRADDFRATNRSTLSVWKPRISTSTETRPSRGRAHWNYSRPHLAGVGALWVDGKFYLVSGPSTQKSRNLAANPSCALSMALPGLDLVVEGRAAKVTDQATLERLAQRYAAQGWPARASDGALTAEYSAPSAGPPPWHLYVVTPLAAFGVAGEKPYGATRWRF